MADSNYLEDLVISQKQTINALLEQIEFLKERIRILELEKNSSAVISNKARRL